MHAAGRNQLVSFSVKQFILSTSNSTYSQLLTNKMYAFKWLKTSRNKFTVFKDLKSEKRENVFICELALTQSLKVHSKS